VTGRGYEVTWLYDSNAPWRWRCTTVVPKHDATGRFRYGHVCPAGGMAMTEGQAQDRALAHLWSGHGIG
jgi:hypothetical protein